jgi:hypothetical protein
MTDLPDMGQPPAPKETETDAESKDKDKSTSSVSHSRHRYVCWTHSCETIIPPIEQPIVPVDEPKEAGTIRNNMKPVHIGGGGGGGWLSWRLVVVVAVLAVLGRLSIYAGRTWSLYLILWIDVVWLLQAPNVMYRTIHERRAASSKYRAPRLTVHLEPPHRPQYRHRYPCNPERTLLNHDCIRRDRSSRWSPA